MVAKKMFILYLGKCDSCELAALPLISVRDLFSDLFGVSMKFVRLNYSSLGFQVKSKIWTGKMMVVLLP